MTSADGTRLEAWTNDADGPAVLLCNGLGHQPVRLAGAAPPDCGVRVPSIARAGAAA